MKPRSAFLVVALSLPVFAEEDLTACADEFSDCQDNCSLRYGTSTQAKDRIKLSKCVGACQKTESACRDRYIETHVHQLDEGAVKNADKHDDDLREDNRKQPIIEQDDDRPRPSAKRSDDDKPRKQATRDEDLPKRTATRAADLDPKPEPKPEPKAEAKAEPREEPKPEAKPEPRPEPKPEPVAEKPDKPEKKADDAPPPKKKQRALDEWDPEAL